MGLADFSLAPANLCPLQLAWARASTPSILRLISKAQKDLNEPVWFFLLLLFVLEDISPEYLQSHWQKTSLLIPALTPGQEEAHSDPAVGLTPCWGAQVHAGAAEAHPSWRSSSWDLSVQPGMGCEHSALPAALGAGCITKPAGVQRGFYYLQKFNKDFLWLQLCGSHLSWI